VSLSPLQRAISIAPSLLAEPWSYGTNSTADVIS